MRAHVEIPSQPLPEKSVSRPIDCGKPNAISYGTYRIRLPLLQYIQSRGNVRKRFLCLSFMESNGSSAKRLPSTAESCCSLWKKYRCYDFFGLFTCRHRAPKPKEVVHSSSYCPFGTCLWNPSTPDLESDTFFHRKARRRSFRNFRVRPYREGDRLRSIHWKLFFPHRRPMVKGSSSLPICSSALIMIDLFG